MFFFLAYFTLYNRLQFHPSHPNWFKWILFNGWVILHCVYVPQLSYPFICWWTSRLFPCPGYYKQCCEISQVEEYNFPFFDCEITLVFYLSAFGRIFMEWQGEGSAKTVAFRDWNFFLNKPLNLDRILKIRDITLPTKFHIVKAMVFPADLYRCESWTKRKAKYQRIDAFELWCWRRLLRVLRLQGDQASQS